MSSLNISRHASRSVSGVAVLQVKGSIDSDTAPAFEKELEGLLEAKQYRLLVDLTQAEYISSAGIGVFVGMLHTFREHKGGDIKVCSVSKKVMKVFEAIGLSELLDFFPAEADLKTWHAAEAVVEPLDHFVLSVTGDVFIGEEFTLRVTGVDKAGQAVADYTGRPGLAVSQGLVSPAELAGFAQGVWEGKAKVTASGTVTLSSADGNWRGTLALAVKVRGEKSVFPLTVACSTCQTPITIPSADIYRCEHCDETFTVDEWGHVFTVKPGTLAKRRKSRYKGMEMKINADVNYLGVVRQTLGGLCRKEGMDDLTTQSVELAVEEILLNLIEHGNDFDPWQILRIKMEFQKKQLKLVIRDYGDPYDITKHKQISLKSSVAKGSKRGVGTFLVNQLMDQVKYETTPNYNELTMTKKYGEPDENEE
jgi:anti-sigma B factor antagonist